MNEATVELDYEITFSGIAHCYHQKPFRFAINSRDLLTCVYTRGLS